MARARDGVSGSRRRIPRVSAMLTAGQGPGCGGGMSRRPDLARRHASTLGVAAVSRRATGSRAARSSATPRECIRGGPGGLWAASCSSMRTRVAGGGSGASSADRVPAARRTDPSRSRFHAAARSSSVTPESSRTTRSILASRCAQRAVVSSSGAITSAEPGIAPMRSRSRFSRPAPTSSAGRSSAVAGRRPGARFGPDPLAASGGGRSAAHVEPTDERLCAAIQWTRPRCARDNTGSRATTRSSGLSRGSAPSWSAPTMPTRAAPRRGATARSPARGFVLLPGFARGERGREGGDQHRRAVRVHAAAELADRLSGAEEALSRDAAERQDDLGLQHRQLRREERGAGGELLGLGISIPGRPTHDGVANVNFVARQLDLSRLEHFRQELSRPPDEGEALSVFVGARALTDDDELRSRVPRAEHDGRTPLAQLALAAALEGLLLGPERLRGIEQIVAGEGELGEPEIAVMAQWLTECA